MAANFKISIRRHNGTTCLRLLGDFDGSSAHELLTAMKDRARKGSRLTIDTNGLRKVHPYGVRVFGAFCGRVSRKIPSLKFTGEYAAELAAEMSPA